MSRSLPSNMLQSLTLPSSFARSVKSRKTLILSTGLGLDKNHPDIKARFAHPLARRSALTHTRFSP